MSYQNLNKKWKTRIILPAIMAAALSGYYARDVRDYFDWRSQIIAGFYPAGKDGLLGKIIQESKALSAYRHRNDIKPEETKTQNPKNDNPLNLKPHITYI